MLKQIVAASLTAIILTSNTAMADSSCSKTLNDFSKKVATTMLGFDEKELKIVANGSVPDSEYRVEVQQGIYPIKSATFIIDVGNVKEERSEDHWDLTCSVFGVKLHPYHKKAGTDFLELN